MNEELFERQVKALEAIDKNLKELNWKVFYVCIWLVYIGVVIGATS